MLSHGTFAKVSGNSLIQAKEGRIDVTTALEAVAEEEAILPATAQEAQGGAVETAERRTRMRQSACALI